MAIIAFTRATNVRLYQDYQVDTDKLTPAQLAAVTKLSEAGDIDDEKPEAQRLLEEITDSLVIYSEDYAPADEDNLNFIFTDKWEDRLI